MNTTEVNIKSDKPKLSACMIVRNEEKFLPQCLDSIKDVVDEIIIVDTGSTDNTVEIAKRYTDKVYFYEWKNDFSSARNYSLQYAGGDWILVIDADEELEREDIPILLSLLRHDGYNSLFFAVLSKVPAGISMNYSQRVFRRGKGHYEGIVHNQLICEGNALVTNIRLHHYGYNLDKEQMRKKYNRTETLLKEQIAQNPDNVFAWMNLVRVYKCQELWDSAIRTAEEVLNSPSHRVDSTAYQMMMYDMAYSLFMSGAYEKAENTCAELLKAYPDNPDGQFLAGGIFICKGDHLRAIRHYKNYLKLVEEKRDCPRLTTLIVDTYGSQANAWNNIGSCYVELGWFDRAVSAYRRAISYNNKEPLYYENLARTFFKLNRIDKVVETLEKAISMGIATSRMHFQLSGIFRPQGKIDKAIEHLRKALETDSGDIKCYIELGELLMLQGRMQEAEEISNSALSLEPDHFGILHNLARIKAKLGEKEESANYISRIMELDGLNADQYLAMGNDWVIMREFEFAVLFYERCLQSDPSNLDALVNLATCYAEMGKYESAIVGYRTALALSPGDPIIIKNLVSMRKAIEANIKACPVDKILP